MGPWRGGEGRSLQPSVAPVASTVLLPLASSLSFDCPTHWASSLGDRRSIRTALRGPAPSSPFPAGERGCLSQEPCPEEQPRAGQGGRSYGLTLGSPPTSLRPSTWALRAEALAPVTWTLPVPLPGLVAEAWWLREAWLLWSQA